MSTSPVIQDSPVLPRRRHVGTLTYSTPQLNTAGHIWWYSDGVLNSDAAQLTAYYNVAGLGQAPRPDQPANYRPAPIVASKVSGSTTNWTANIAAKNRYQIVYTTGGAWTVLGGSVYFPGTLGATITGATQVEVLVDERPYVDGDANLDGAIDTVDFTTVASHFNTAGNAWATGDFNGDGVVNALDFNILASGYGQSLSASALPPGSLVPEPAMIGLFGAALLARRRR